MIPQKNLSCSECWLIYWESYYACPVVLSSIPRIISIAEESSINDILTNVWNIRIENIWDIIFHQGQNSNGHEIYFLTTGTPGKGTDGRFIPCNWLIRCMTHMVTNVHSIPSPPSASHTPVPDTNSSLTVPLEQAPFLNVPFQKSP